MYDNIKAQTMHLCYGLQTADMPSHMVLPRSSSLRHCMQKIKAEDTIIWDEAGMSSKRTLELNFTSYGRGLTQPHQTILKKTSHSSRQAFAAKTSDQYLT